MGTINQVLEDGMDTIHTLKTVSILTRSTGKTRLRGKLADPCAVESPPGEKAGKDGPQSVSSFRNHMSLRDNREQEFGGEFPSA